MDKVGVGMASAFFGFVVGMIIGVLIVVSGYENQEIDSMVP